MPVFALPLALLGLAGLPALAGIYWLRNRHRRQVVSSLLLWSDLTRPKEGGTRVQRLQTPLLLLLELLMVGLLVLAASDPRVLAAEAQRPLVVVLDDSYSMQAVVDRDGAGRALTARDRGVMAVLATLADEPRLAARFVLAGPTPRPLGVAVGDLGAAVAALEGWRPRGAGADLDAAVSLAGELGGAGSRVLVVTDHEASGEVDAAAEAGGRVVWRAVGKAMGNAAMVNAVRGGGDVGGGEERVLLEVANLSDDSRSVRLRTGNATEEALEMEAGEVVPTWLAVPRGAGSATVRASVESAGDPLALDDDAALLPPPGRVVAVRVDVADEAMRDAVVRALDASRLATRVSRDEAVLITDGEASSEAVRGWTLQLLLPRKTSEAQPGGGPDAATAESLAYIGPFILDRSHPLAEGLSLAGVVWAATPGEAVPGAAVVSAGDVPLLTDASTTRGGGRVHLIRLRLDPAASTLQATPNLPALIYNLLAWRAAAMAATPQVNARLGGRVDLAVDERVASANLVDPDEATATLPVVAGRVSFEAALPGLYRVTTPEVERINAAGEREVAVDAREIAIAVHPLSLAESDLRTASSGTRGTWQTTESIKAEYHSVAWMLLLAVCGLLAVHAWLLSRRS